MNARILDPSEWPRLEAPHLPQTIPFVPERDVAVVVVEDESGEIVACMSVLKVTHFEGVWIDPRYRGNPGVAGPLWEQARAIPHVRGEQWVLGGAADEDECMHALLGRRGALLPLRFYALSVGEKGPCLQQSSGNRSSAPSAESQIAGGSACLHQ